MLPMSQKNIAKVNLSQNLFFFFFLQTLMSSLSLGLFRALTSSLQNLTTISIGKNS